MKAILKYRYHPSIVAIRNQCKNRPSFSFTEADKKETEHLILNQDVNKVSQTWPQGGEVVRCGRPPFLVLCPFYIL